MQEEQDNYYEIDIMQILKALKRRALAITAFAAVVALIFFLVSTYLTAPMYQAQTMMYINNSISEQIDELLGELEDPEEVLDALDIQDSQHLIDTCIALINTRAMYDEVKKETNTGYSYNELKGMVAAEAVSGTEFLKITVNSTVPEDAAELANAYVNAASKIMAENVKGVITKQVDKATVPNGKLSPNVKKNTIQGFMLGLIIAMGVVTLLELMNKVIRTEKELNTAVKNVPVLGVIPDIKSFEKSRGMNNEYEKNGLISGMIPFAYNEAYKAFRANIIYLLPDDERGRIIGITSACRNDGKRTNSLNTALSIAETGKKVLFLDCDLRLSTTAEILELKKIPGLSNILTGKVKAEDAVQRKIFGKDGTMAMDVITAGDCCPNPTELLTSLQMAELCNESAQKYDYIIADLPPVEIVSDALALSGVLDGMIVVVTEGKSECEEIKSTINKIEFIGGKLLGFIYSNHYEKPKKCRYGKHDKYEAYGYESYEKR